MSINHRNPREFSERATVIRLAAPILRAHGAELVDLELVGAPGGRVLRLFVEKAGSAEQNLSGPEASVIVDTCAGIARELSPALDVADLISGRYDLEVSTPGVERALRGARDFARFAGQKVKIVVEPAVEGQKVFTGTLKGIEGDIPAAPSAAEEANDELPTAGPFFVLLAANAADVRIPGESITRANLVFGFGANDRSKGKQRPKHRSL